MKSLRLHKKVVRSFKAAKGISQVIAVLLMIAIAVIAALVAYFWITGYFKSTSTKVSNAIQIQNVAYTGTHLIAYVQNVGKGTVHFTSNQCLYVDGALRTGASVNPNTLQVSSTASVIDNITLSIGQRIKLKLVTTEGTFVEYYFTINKFTGDYVLAVHIVGQGNVNMDPSGGAYFYDSVQLTAIPDAHWRFSGWSGDILDTANPVDILVNGDKDVTANFEQYQFQVEFHQTGLDGTATGTVVSVTIGSDTYPESFNDLPFTTPWIDAGTQVTYSYTPTVSSTAGTQFIYIGVTGPTSPITVTSDETVTGNYGSQFYLTVSSPYGTTGGQGWYEDGATAYASLDIGSIDHGNGTHHVFTSWDGDATGTNVAQSDAIIMNGPKTAIAGWKTQYSVSFASSPASGGTTNPSGTDIWYDAGAAVPINATANVGYAFSSWGSDTSNIIIAEESAQTTTAAINGPGIVTATFTQNTYTITVTVLPSVTAGNVTRDLSPPYHYGDVVTLTESPSAGYTFSGWSDDGSGTGTTCQITVTRDMTVTASFTLSPYSITVNLNPPAGGDVTLDKPAPYYYGDVVTLTEYPNPGYAFSGWSDDGSGTGTTCQITVTRDMTVTATFTLDQFQITVTASPSGAIGGTFVVTYTKSGTTYTNVPEIAGWTETVDAGTVVTVSQPQQYVPSAAGAGGIRYNFTGYNPSASVTMTGNETITLVYQTQYQVTFVVNPSSPVPGTTTPSGIQWYDSGANVPITATVTNSSYLFANWTVTGSISIANAFSNVTTATIGGTGTITANFGLRSYFGVIYYTGDITIGSNEIVTGILYGPPTGSQVTLTYTRPDGSQVIRTTNTILGLLFISSYTPDTAGNWQVVVSYAGSGQYAPISAAPYSFSVNKISTSLSCSESPATVGIGQSITVSGSLTPASGSGLSGQTITLTFTRPDLSTFTGTAVTGPSGSYTYSYTPNALGSWSVVASWLGDATHTSATSSPQSFMVANAVSITITLSPAGSGLVSVDGAYITTPQTFNWMVGSTHTLYATLTVPNVTGVQYVFINWSDGGAYTHTYTVPSSDATVTANYKTQYYFTVNSPAGTNPTGQNWCDANTQASSSVTSPVTVAGPPRIDYMLTGYTGTGSAPASGSDTSVSFTINAPSSITWHWSGRMTLYPEGDGSTSLNDNWSGHDNYESVSDPGASDSTHYVLLSSGSSWVYDRYITQNHGSASGTINSVAVYIRCEKSGSNNAYAETVLRFGSNNYYSSDPGFTLTGSWTDYSYIYSRPGGGTWSWSDIDSLQCGVRLQRGSSTEARCTLVWLVIDFTI